MPIRVGVVGLGMWGRVHLEGLRSIDRARCELSWVCTRTRSNLESVQRDFGVLNATTDLDEMLADPDLDAVIVSTPPFLHAEQGRAVLEAGKHLLLEKPLAITREDADRVVAAAAAHPRQVALEASCRFSRLNPKYDFIRGLLAEGKIGEVYHIHHHEMRPETWIEYNPGAADWAEKADRAGGGPLVDWAPYDFAFHLGLLDDPPVRRITAVGRLDRGIDRHVSALLEFDGGVSFAWERVFGLPYQEAGMTRIHGSTGTLSFTYQSYAAREVVWWRRSEGRPLVREPLDFDYTRDRHENTYLLEHFLDCIAGAASPITSFPLARRNLEISFEIQDRLGSAGRSA